MSELPTTPPPYSPEAKPFWSAAAAGRLVLPVCDSCGHHIWYPRSWCPACGGPSVTWTELSGRGTIYSRTILRRSMGSWADAAPYVIAFVELAEGPRILTNVVTDDPDAVQIGDEVTAVFVPVTASADRSDREPPAQAIVRFRPS